MSFLRLIYLSSLIGGWSGFVGWLVMEIPLGRLVDQPNSNWATFGAILMACLIAIPIGGGISFASALSNPNWLNLVKHVVVGCVGGLCGGVLGSLPGMCIFGLLQQVPGLAVIGRILGFTLIGVGLGIGMGAMEGIVDRSFKKMRNGLIGGVIGGFLGGLCFPLIISVTSPMPGRAVAFVLLGLSIGLFIGLAQVILKEAWLTVEQGFRPGRQIILGNEEVTMGTSEKATLIFIAFGAKGVEPTHLRIFKQPDGTYELVDNQSRTGTLLNGAPISGRAILSDGDAIQLGVNVVRFRERAKHARSDEPLPQPVIQAPLPQPVPAGAIQSRPPLSPPKPALDPVMQAVTVKPAPSAVKPAVVAAAPKAAPMPAKPAPAPAQPAAKPTPAVEVQPQEGRCPICDKKIVGIPGQRRCKSCFTTF
jgi:MFS family permease